MLNLRPKKKSEITSNIEWDAPFAPLAILGRHVTQERDQELVRLARSAANPQQKYWELFAKEFFVEGHGLTKDAFNALSDWEDSEDTPQPDEHGNIELSADLFTTLFIFGRAEDFRGKIFQINANMLKEAVARKNGSGGEPSDL